MALNVSDSIDHIFRLCEDRIKRLNGELVRISIDSVEALKLIAYQTTTVVSRVSLDYAPKAAL